jgi:AcrR family transcriptional regulator
MIDDLAPAMSQADDPTRRRILAAAKENLRRFGAGKVTVVDIARNLGMSHSNVYRFFRTKVEILDAVIEEWLTEEEAQFGEMAWRGGTASERLEGLTIALLERKRRKREQDAELLAHYYRVLNDRPEALARYDGALAAAFTRVVADGVQSGEFAVGDINRAVRVIRHAIGVFFDPEYERQNGESPEAGARDVIRALAAGFTNRAAPPKFGA